MQRVALWSLDMMIRNDATNATELTQIPEIEKHPKYCLSEADANALAIFSNCQLGQDRIQIGDPKAVYA